jgi:hypothetical protein
MARQPRYSPEVKERAVRLMREQCANCETESGGDLVHREQDYLLETTVKHKYRHPCRITGVMRRCTSQKRNRSEDDSR